MSDNDLHNERELLAGIADGDEGAFARLFHHYASQLHIPILKITKTEAATDDVLQETFLRVWLYRDRLPAIENPRSWIFRVAYSRAFNHLRSLAIHQKALGNIGTPAVTATETSDTIDLRTMATLIKQAIQQLPPRQKEIYILSREKYMTAAEIAVHLKISVQTVKNSLGLALKSIRAFLESSGYLSLYAFLFWHL